MNKISSFQLFCILFASRLLGTFTYMSQLQTTLHAGSRILSACICFFISFIGSMPVLVYFRRQNNTSFLNSVQVISNKSARVLGSTYAVVFLFAAVVTLTRFGLFAGTVLLQNTGLYISVFFLLLVSIYCAHQGLPALAKTAVIFGVILLISLIPVTVGNISSWQLLNIPAPQINETEEILKQAFFSACRNIEIPALLFIADQIKGRISSVVIKFLFAFSFISVVLFTIAGGVLGEYGEQQMFPLFTLSSVADIGIFEHMEDLLTGIWIVCAMLKTAFLLYVASQCLQKSIKKDISIKHISIGGGLIFTGYLLFSSNIPTAIRLLRNWVIPAGFIIFAVLIPSVFHILICRKEKKRRKENTK